MNYSKQREVIQHIVLSHKIHPTADMVYRLLHEEYPNISLATVYRNLNKLTEIGVISKITIPNASDRFDGTVMEHYHMICSCCGEVFDCPITPFSEIDSAIEKETGFSVAYHQLLVYGMCKQCNKRKTQNV